MKRREPDRTRVCRLIHQQYPWNVKPPPSFCTFYLTYRASASLWSHRLDLLSQRFSVRSCFTSCPANNSHVQHEAAGNWSSAASYQTWRNQGCVQSPPASSQIQQNYYSSLSKRSHSAESNRPDARLTPSLPSLKQTWGSATIWRSPVLSLLPQAKTQVS